MPAGQEGNRGENKGEPKQDGSKNHTSGCVHVVRTFAQLLATHRYYGTIAATSRECLLQQENGLPKLFLCDTGADKAPCCSAPSFVLRRNLDSANPSEAATLTESVSSAFGQPKSFRHGDIASLPLHLLEGCSQTFQALWKTRLQHATKVLSGSKLQALHHIPLYPAAVVTLVRCLEAMPVREQKNDAADVAEFHVVLPITVTLVMDWKLNDESTHTVRMEFPGIILGKLGHDRQKSMSIKFVEIEIEYQAMLQSMMAQIKPFLQNLLMVTWVWVSRQQQQVDQGQALSHMILMRSSIANAGKEKKEQINDEEETMATGSNDDFADFHIDNGRTPLENLFASADSNPSQLGHESVAQEDAKEEQEKVEEEETSESKSKPMPIKTAPIDSSMPSAAANTTDTASKPMPQKTKPIDSSMPTTTGAATDAEQNISNRSDNHLAVLSAAADHVVRQEQEEAMAEPSAKRRRVSSSTDSAD